MACCKSYSLFYLKFGYISNSLKRGDKNEISALFYPMTLHIDNTKFCIPSVPTHELKNNIIFWIKKPTMKRIWIGSENCWINKKKQCLRGTCIVLVLSIYCIINKTILIFLLKYGCSNFHSSDRTDRGWNNIFQNSLRTLWAFLNTVGYGILLNSSLTWVFVDETINYFSNIASIAVQLQLLYCIITITVLSSGCLEKCIVAYHHVSYTSNAETSCTVSQYLPLCHPITLKEMFLCTVCHLEN